jgi:hypothetical protein
MKVESLSIHRISVKLSCGCGVIADFKDRLCKEPFAPLPNKEGEEVVEASKVYDICKKHAKDPQRSMLEFMMAERLEEAVAEAQKAPAAPQRLVAGVPMAPTENFDGEAVQKVAALAGPKRPPIVKTIKRNQEQLAAAGAAVDRELAGVAAEESGVAFAADGPAQSLDQLLDDSDPTENKNLTQAKD